MSPTRIMGPDDGPDVISKHHILCDSKPLYNFYVDVGGKTGVIVVHESIKSYISNIIGNIPSKHYKAYIKYAYESKDVRKYTPKKSSRRKKLKKYKK